MNALALNTLDDRRELDRLLARLPPRRRVAFLARCCGRAAVPHSATRPGVRHDTWARVPSAERDDEADRRLTTEVYFDLWCLAMQYGLDLRQAALDLEAEVKAFCRGRGRTGGKSKTSPGPRPGAW